MERSLGISGETEAARSREGGAAASDRTRIATIIRKGKAALGIELGSTRVKAVAVDADLNIIASGSSQWEKQRYSRTRGGASRTGARRPHSRKMEYRASVSGGSR